METWDAITSRRNVRQFAEQPIDDAVLDRILEAGRRAPSSRNWQPWDFVVVTDRAQLERLSKLGPGSGHVRDSGATIALVIEDFDDQATRERARYDVGQATMAMMIAAADQGIGSGHAGVQDQATARDVLGLPDDRRVGIHDRLRLPRGSTARPDQPAGSAAVRRGRAPRSLVAAG